MVNKDELKMEVATLTEGYDMISVTNEEEYAAAIKMQDAAYARKKAIEEWFAPKVEAANRAHKLLTTERGEMVKPLDAFIRHISGETGSYKAEQQRKEQARLDAVRKEAERVEAEQRARAAKEAEELRKKQEAERKAAEEVFKNSPAELAKAKAKMEAEQAAERARQEAKAAASIIDTSLLPTMASKSEVGPGRSLVETWDFEVTDEATVPDAYKTLDLSKIRKQVQLTKDKTNIPGIRIFKKTELRRAGGRRE